MMAARTEDCATREVCDRGGERQFHANGEPVKANTPGLSPQHALRIFRELSIPYSRRSNATRRRAPHLASCSATSVLKLEPAERPDPDCERRSGEAQRRKLRPRACVAWVTL
jgi:hypothetical protein